MYFFSILAQNTYTNIIVDVKFKYVLCITRIEANYGGLLWKFSLEFWYSNQGWSPFVLLYLENYALSKSVSTTESIEVWHTDNGDVLGGEVNSPPVTGPDHSLDISWPLVTHCVLINHNGIRWHLSKISTRKRFMWRGMTFWKIQIIFSLNSKWVIFNCYRKKSIEK